MTEQVIAGYIAGILSVFLIIAVIYYVLVVIATWKIFKKAGEAGWKCLIPFYNEYILYKISWKTKMFWITLLLFVIGYSLMQFGGANATGVYSYMAFIGSLLTIAAYIVNCVAFYLVGVSFGHGLPFFILALFLPNIALLYLGFSKDEYRGNLS